MLEHHVHRTPIGGHFGDALAVKVDVARGWRFEPGQHPQRRGLAATRWSKKRQELTLSDAEGQRVGGQHFAIELRRGAEFGDQRSLGQSGTGGWALHRVGSIL